MMTVSVDGTYILRRCSFASPGKWPHYAAIFTKTLTAILENFWPDQVYILWDNKSSSSRRKEMFEGYKGGRQRPDKHATAACSFLHMYLPKLGAYSISIPRCEADDLAQLVMVGNSGVHISEDRDWYLNLREDWELYRPASRETVTWEGLCNKFETDDPVTRYLYIKSLTGDNSDSVPGVSGIGPKRAISCSKALMEGKEIKDKRMAEMVKRDFGILQRNLLIFDTKWILSDEGVRSEFEVQRSKSDPKLESWNQFCCAVSSSSMIQLWGRWKKAIGGDNGK